MTIKEFAEVLTKACKGELRCPTYGIIFITSGIAGICFGAFRLMEWSGWGWIVWLEIIALFLWVTPKAFDEI